MEGLTDVIEKAVCAEARIVQPVVLHAYGGSPIRGSTKKVPLE